MKFHDFLKKHNACSEGMAFVGNKTLRQFWNDCPQPDWMLWLMEKANYQDDRMYRLYACWCACNTPLADGRVTWDLLTDKRSRDAVKVAIRYANGEATQEELDAASDAAWDAARHAARAAARAAARDDVASEAAWVVAGVVASEAAWVVARAAARGAAWGAAKDAQANHLRSVVDFKKLERLIKEAK